MWTCEPWRQGIEIDLSTGYDYFVFFFFRGWSFCPTDGMLSNSQTEDRSESPDSGPGRNGQGGALHPWKGVALWPVRFLICIQGSSSGAIATPLPQACSLHVYSNAASC